MAIPITDTDTVAESVEQFFAVLSRSGLGSDPDVVLSPAQTTIEITDNDGKLKLLEV